MKERGWSPGKQLKVKGRGATGFGWEKNITFKFFSFGYPKFLSFKFLYVNFPPIIMAGGFTYIENFYTYYSRKYCNNYCRDCLL